VGGDRRGLSPADFVERDVESTEEQPIDVGVGLAVPHEQEHAPNLPVIRKVFDGTPTGRCLVQHTSGGHMPSGDELKGRAKEAVGDLTDDEDLQREGKVDQAEGKVKEAVDNVTDKIEDMVNKDK
jgi:uncharacterized protein YjbJ (UPF0337 family)